MRQNDAEALLERINEVLGGMDNDFEKEEFRKFKEYKWCTSSDYRRLANDVSLLSADLDLLRKRSQKLKTEYDEMTSWIKEGELLLQKLVPKAATLKQDADKLDEVKSELEELEKKYRHYFERS